MKEDDDGAYGVYRTIREFTSVIRFADSPSEKSVRILSYTMKAVSSNLSPRAQNDHPCGEQALRGTIQ